MQRPNPHAGMRHLALFVENFDETLRFYTELLGMAVEWQPVELVKENRACSIYSGATCPRPAAASSAKPHHPPPSASFPPSSLRPQHASIAESNARKF